MDYKDVMRDVKSKTITLTLYWLFSLQYVKMKSAVRKLKIELLTALSLACLGTKTAFTTSKHSFYSVI